MKNNDNSNYIFPVVLCVGTTKVVGDSIGPRVGDILVERGADAYVYGKSARPVHGRNYSEYVDFIRTHHRESITIAVDACLGAKEDVGKVKYAFKGLSAGSALKKDLPTFGDLSVLCVVAERSGDNLTSLIRAEEALVESLADRCAKKILTIVENLRLNYTAGNKIKWTASDEG